MSASRPRRHPTGDEHRPGDAAPSDAAAEPRRRWPIPAPETGATPPHRRAGRPADAATAERCHRSRPAADAGTGIAAVPPRRLAIVAGLSAAAVRVGVAGFAVRASRSATKRS